MTVQSTELEAQLEAIRLEAQQALVEASSLDQLEQLRVKYLGKKGPIPLVLGGMGKLIKKRLAPVIRRVVLNAIFVLDHSGRPCGRRIGRRRAIATDENDNGE